MPSFTAHSLPPSGLLAAELRALVTQAVQPVPDSSRTSGFMTASLRVVTLAGGCVLPISRLSQQASRQVALRRMVKIGLGQVRLTLH